VKVGAAAVNFPDVLLIADEYQISVPPPFVPGSEFAGVIVETGEGADGFAVGDLVTGTGLYGAFAEEVVGARRRPFADTRRRRRAHRRGVWRGVPHGVSHSAVDGPCAGGRRVDRSWRRRKVSALRRSSSACSSAPRSPPWRHRPKSLMWQQVTAPSTLVNHTSDDLRGALRDAVPCGANAVIDPVGGELSEPALRSLSRGGRFVTIGFASGVIPRIPLNLVLVKGVQVLGFQFQDVPPDEFARNERELRELLVNGRVLPHVCAVYPLAEAAAALRHVADGRAIGKVVIDLA